MVATHIKSNNSNDEESITVLPGKHNTKHGSEDNLIKGFDKGMLALTRMIRSPENNALRKKSLTNAYSK